MTRRVEQVDTETGEVLGGFVAVVQPKRKNGFGDGWVAMSQNAMRAIREAGLQGRDYDVLFALLEVLDFENLIQVSQVEMAAELGMQKSHLSRSIKRLLEIGILLEGPKIGRSKTFRLNPSFGWKGSAKGHTDALKERMKAAGLSVVKGGGQQEGDAHLQQDAFEGA